MFPCIAPLDQRIIRWLSQSAIYTVPKWSTIRPWGCVTTALDHFLDLEHQQQQFLLLHFCSILSHDDYSNPTHKLNDLHWWRCRKAIWVDQDDSLFYSSLHQGHRNIHHYLWSNPNNECAKWEFLQFDHFDEVITQLFNYSNRKWSEN
jgi:hypothetical protein